MFFEGNDKCLLTTCEVDKTKRLVVDEGKFIEKFMSIDEGK